MGAGNSYNISISHLSLIGSFQPCRFANALVYYGLNINTRNLAGDPYLNFFIAACVEIPSVILTILVIDKLGRRWLFFIFMVISGLGCIGTAFVPDGKLILVLIVDQLCPKKMTIM